LEAVIFFETNFRFFPQKNLGIFGLICFSSVILTNFANIGPNFAKFLTSQIWEKKKKKTPLVGRGEGFRNT
jgi:hypothetical protein